MKNEKLKISQKTGAWCSGAWRSNKGMALLTVLIMISSLVGVIMLCAFVLSHEVDKDERHQITRERMLEVKRALIGRLADTGGGKGITAGGGFISDFGEPDDINSFINNNFIPVLLDEPDAYPDWSYDSGRQFWAGYRVWAANDGSYLIAPPGQPNPTAQFWDGWGFPLEVAFLGDEIEIRSRGSDGPGGVESALDYRQDIVKTFHWRRGVTVGIHNNSHVASPPGYKITGRLVYPRKGEVRIATYAAIINIATGATVSTTFANIPVGLRKMQILEGDLTGTVRQTTVFSLPPGSGIFNLGEIVYPE
ncbi:hypothetical protein M1N66_02095 [Thermodesulfovibrionales bacterium]|nr:hypothetical protein [Thermodesulfovibrionales bacterium]